MMLVTNDAEQQTWDLFWDDHHLRLRLMRGLLICEYFGPRASYTPTTSWPPPDPIQLTRTEARIGLLPVERSVRWSHAVWSQPKDEVLLLVLQSHEVPLEAELRFQVDGPTGLLRRGTTLRHTGDGPSVEIGSALSFSALLPDDIEEVVHLAGRLVAETQVQRLPLSETPLLLESRAGKTGYRYAPYVALCAPTHTYLIELCWSGNWQIHIERQPDGRVHISGGLNPWGLRHRFLPGDRLELPEALLACVPGDLNAATQRLHDFRRGRRPNPTRPIPIHFNTWYPANEWIPVQQAKAYARQAAALGCEVFVLDAGWYTTESDASGQGWWSRTGDWIVNRRLYPNGLEELSDACRELGLGFGMWFEPEAVGVDARVRRDHPEWFHAIGGIPTPRDERATLHLGVPEARVYIRDRIIALLRATGAVWMKWDFNTDLLQGGWSPDLPEQLTAQDPLVVHYHGLYQLQDEVRTAFPDLTLEMCAGGGSRIDGAIMAHAHTNWMSDQTQPLVNLAIHFGSHLAHPAVECNDWLVEWPPHDALQNRQWVDERGDLPFRIRIAMLGTFGISAPLDRWTEQDRATVRTHIAWYKCFVQPLLLQGDQYLLTPAPPLDGKGDWAAVWYKSKDGARGVLFAFRLAGGEDERAFVLPGLIPDARYTVMDFDKDREEFTGAELAAGHVVTIDAPYRSVLLAVERA